MKIKISTKITLKNLEVEIKETGSIEFTAQTLNHTGSRLKETNIHEVSNKEKGQIYTYRRILFLGSLGFSGLEITQEEAEEIVNIIFS